jgi:hypothetical protein
LLPSPPHAAIASDAAGIASAIVILLQFRISCSSRLVPAVAAFDSVAGTLPRTHESSVKVR